VFEFYFIFADKMQDIVLMPSFGRGHQVTFSLVRTGFGCPLHINCIDREAVDGYEVDELELLFLAVLYDETQTLALG
jgi:hypothetical protein